MQEIQKQHRELEKLFYCLGDWVNLKVSNVLDHAASEVHKVAMTRMHADAAKAKGVSVLLQMPIGRSLATID